VFGEISERRKILNNSAEGVKDVAGEALGAAAAAAAGVVMVRAAEALLTGGEELKEAAPAVSEAARETAAAPFISKPATPARPVAHAKKAAHPSAHKGNRKSTTAQKK
jgi:hypothetical protein